ncbi:MAG: hypothetical protein A3C85_00330 [Candidatus Doudnabacteria bacterium RIFCSPHIGHO2_02_FULL_48_21]|uniref:Septum formation initiator n=1 Tax=Candidatus Doudnabacteria bacterium RIFCSPLOWO2_02_FULL_48_13 TaxID=1817845 RepID=A0A1F5QCT3_9BACT|nr:MAG: hypothetical protein A3K05_01210 [Candidatus Doudnabacteria bacterium RIFCSPHIGHO2_01_48_18]OGE79161.1 MAG: hypothetical protein A2668_00280 [Candidatus Doudnabacteria bacterium RIFCSPHIGHO2_01_FULL_48_180]OGE91793.1 MAG: hypothetical protein A3F44_00840 [Candidatus Doudnabacteria bacterium RIFCSPHIGHO2_12_FULL_47_25]OGE93643.1 MAG: hypothetical protein A3C85_00330 [Candidatus Doudnabacteria bacterium RIFCSPHIGHO2_02_FULL_48_21]OGE97924.1 MAG: hypothetical protein A3A83_00515 [Candidatu
MFYRLLKSRLGIVVGILLLMAIIFYLAKETYKKRQIDQVIAGLEDEIAAAEGRNKEILELISYYKTTEYKERQARSLLGLQKEGEFAVALPQSQSAKPSETAGANADNRANYQKWWDYFFGAR